MNQAKRPVSARGPLNIDGISRPVQNITSPNSKNIAKKFKKYLLLRRTVLLTIVILVLVVIGIVAKPKLTPHRDDLNNVTTVQRLVGKHYLLPPNETPALATVTDRAKLTTKFLQKAQNGDKILIYQQASRVIIYRPGIDRIIDVGPVQIAPLSPSEQTK